MAVHTVLVVDDEPASVRAVARTLADECRVITATTAATALEALARDTIALVIVDQRMPEMNGTDLLARCAAERPEIIRVLLTGYTDVDTLLDAINAGHVYHYLTKPWEPRDLLLVVRRGLERYDVEADRRRLLCEIEQALARVRREAAQKGRLLALATHELGTPVHVLTNALLLAAEAQPPTPVREWLETAQRSAAWLGRTLAQMATASRWRGGRLRLERRPCALAPLLDRLQATFGVMTSQRCLAFHRALDDDGLAVNVDPVWFECALINLLSNAVRFTADGGHVSVTATRAGTHVAIAVCDTGIGIGRQFHAELFEPFSAACGDVSLHGSGRFEFGARGLGLGLAITKAIVDQHDGCIDVRSEPGRGSQFTITLPAWTAPLPAP